MAAPISASISGAVIVGSRNSSGTCSQLPRNDKIVAMTTPKRGAELHRCSVLHHAETILQCARIANLEALELQVRRLPWMQMCCIRDTSFHIVVQ